MMPKATYENQNPSGDQGFSSYNMLNNLQAIHQLDFVPFRPLAHTPPDMQIMVLGSDASGYQKGIYYGNNSQRVDLVSGDTIAMAAPGTFDRIDLVYLHTNGQIGVETGDESQTPMVPAPPSGDVIPVALIYHPYGTDRIVNYGDRHSYSGDSYIMQDVRPFYGVPRATGTSLDDQIARNTKNAMANFLLLMSQHAISKMGFVDGWADEFSDPSGIVLKSVVSGDGLRYSRNYTHNGSPQYNVIHDLGSNVGGDGKAVVIGGKAAFGFKATRARVMVITASGDGISAEISMDSGDTWNTVPLSLEFVQTGKRYHSGLNETMSGTNVATTGDYYVAFTIPSGDRTTIEGYAVTLT